MSIAVDTRPAARSRVALLYAVFFVSGVPSLIYQVVWQRVLTVYFGVDIYSTSVTVSIFMLGLGLGILIHPAPGTILRALHYAAHDGVFFRGIEDRSGVVALRRQDEVLLFEQERRALGRTSLFINGARHGTMDPRHAKAENALAVGAALAAHPAPREVLVIGLGDAVMAAGAIEAPAVDRVTVVELSSALHQLLAKTERGALIMGSEKLRYEVDDGRRWLLAHPGERFDLAMMAPLHAAQAYVNNLYSLEFLTLVRERLSAAGVLLVQSFDAFATARTIALVFPHVIRLGSTHYVASRAPIDEAQIAAAIGRERLDHLLQADRDTILTHTADVAPNTDLRPNSEYYLTYRHTRLLTSAPEIREAAREALYRKDGG